MRAALLLVATLAGTAQADDADLAFSGGGMIGHFTAKTGNDKFGQGPGEYGAWVGGLTGHISYVGLPSPYSAGLGVFGDFTMLAMTPGGATRDGQSADEAPATPFGLLYYLNFAAAGGVAMDVVRTHRVTAELDLGAVLDSDFYGLTAEAEVRVKVGTDAALVAAYRLRDGRGWSPSAMRDERTRFGLALPGYAYVGFEYLHGYNEDAMGLADLKSLLKGGYSMFAVVISVGK